MRRLHDEHTRVGGGGHKPGGHFTDGPSDITADRCVRLFGNDAI
jgi:hypothetical protein